MMKIGTGVWVVSSRSLLAAAMLAALPWRTIAAPKPTAFLENYCYDCHDADVKKGGLDLDGMSFRPEGAVNRRDWLRVYDQVRTAKMPPPDKKNQPSAAEREQVTQWLNDELVRAERQSYATEGRAAVRRLSRDEHIQALRDLLRLPELTTGEKLPPDSHSDGFGKSSSALPFSHVQVDRYLEVANLSLRAAMAPQLSRPEARKARVWVSDLRGKTVKQGYGKARGEPTLVLSKMSPFLYLALKEGYGMPVTSRRLDTSYENWPGNFAQRKPGYVRDTAPFMDAIGIPTHRTLPIGREFRANRAGRYKLRVGAYSYRANKGKVQPTDRTEVIAFYSDTRLLGHVDITPKATVQELEVYLRAGEEVSVTVASLKIARLDGGEKGRRYAHLDVPAVAIQGFEMEGPFVDEWPPAGHQRLFGRLPLKPLPGKRSPKDRGLDYEVVSVEPASDARRLLSAFIPECYRRPLQPDDLRIPLKSFQRRIEQGASFQEAMLSAYASVLSSPHFILVSADPGSLEAEDLANRLALFLWLTPADGELRKSLNADTIRSPDKFTAFVDRMIDDARAERFVRHFLDYWLDLRNIGVTEPDENLYHGYTPWLLESMLMETRAYFLRMLREDLPARTVIGSDFAMVNGALAELYNIKGVKGGSVRPVALNRDSVRGGFLTQASVLKVSANGTTTSPVVRGTYVMDRLLGDPPPPPPEAVAAVEPDLSGATTIREQLAKHRADPACASCHRKIDPPGFALESFDVMGRFRTRYHSLEKGDPVKGINRRGKPIKFKLALPVDSSGETADGRPFRDVEEFRGLILQDQRALARNLVEQLVIYSTGAPIGISDRGRIEQILDETEANGFGLRSLIHAIVRSDWFLKK